MKYIKEDIVFSLSKYEDMLEFWGFIFLPVFFLFVLIIALITCSSNNTDKTNVIYEEYTVTNQDGTVVGSLNLKKEETNQ